MKPRHHHHIVNNGHEALLCRCEKDGHGPTYVVLPDGKITTYLTERCTDPECGHRMFDDPEEAE